MQKDSRCITQRFLPGIVLMIGLLSFMDTSAQTETALDEMAKNMDLAANPCQDFYQYACGGWIANTTLPESEIQWVRGFDQARIDVRDRLYALMQEAASHYPSGNVDQDRIGAFYKSCMNQPQAEQTETQSLQPYLDLIDSINTHSDFLRVAAQLQALDGSRLFATDIMPNPSPSGSGFYTLRAAAGDPGMQDGDVYTRKDKYSKALYAWETDYINQTLLKLNVPGNQIKRHIKQIMAIEKVLAKHNGYYDQSKSRKIYYISSYQLSYVDKSIDWDVYFNNLPIKFFNRFYISADFIKALGPVLAKTPIDALRSYLRWSLILNYARYLPDSYKPNTPAIFNVDTPPRWQVCVNQTSNLLGEAVGKLLTDNDATRPNIALAESLLSQINTQFIGNLSAAPWLDNQSIQATRDKFDNLAIQIGIPRQWPDYSELTINDTDFIANVIAAKRFEFKKQMSRYDKRVNRQEWDIHAKPQTVNASYYPLKNQIHLLAGLMRAPFLAADNPNPLNYAGFASVISHEMTHGFNAIGHLFDASGRYQDIWSKKTTNNFNKLSQCVVKQYASYRAAPGVRINGKRTLEENLSDINSVKLAYQAYSAIGNDSANTYRADSLTLTGAQVFFIAYAQNFCQTDRSNYQAYLTSRSWWRYAPNRYRATGPLVNRPEFAQAFNCPVNSAMNPKNKCTIW